MPELPRISGLDAGCVIPAHKELAVGTLRSAIRQAKITPEDFIKAFESR